MTHVYSRAARASRSRTDSISMTTGIDHDRRRTGRCAVLFCALGVAVALAWVALANSRADVLAMLRIFGAHIAVGALAAFVVAWFAGRACASVMNGASVWRASLAGVGTAVSSLVLGTTAGALTAYGRAFAESGARHAPGFVEYVLKPVAVVALFGGVPAIALGLVFVLVVRAPAARAARRNHARNAA